MNRESTETQAHMSASHQTVYLSGHTRNTGMSTRSTFGWSLFTSGIVTLLLIALPGDSLWWGLGLTVVGLLALLGGGGSRY